MLGRVRVRGGSGSGLHGSIARPCSSWVFGANFAANQSRANRCVPDCVPPLCVPAPAPRFPWKHRWKLRFYEVQKVPLFAVTAGVTASSKVRCSLLTSLVNQPTTARFRGYRHGYRWMSPPFNMAQYPVKPSISAIFYIATSAVLGCLHKAKTRSNGRAGAVAFWCVLLRCAT